MRFLSKEDVRQALAMPEAIELMRDAFVQLSSGEAIVPMRLKMEVPQDSGRALIMPVYLPRNKQIGVKIVSLMDENPAKGLPFIHGIVVVLDSNNGQPLALMDGEHLTAMRTGAASGLATDLLARKNAEVAAIFGAGAQGRAQLEAVCAVRPIKRAYLFARDMKKGIALAADMSTLLKIKVEVAKSPDLLSSVDIICTATTSTTALFEHENLKKGVHLNAIGAYRPDMCEIPASTVARAKVVVDHRASCLREAGDILQPIQQGLIDEEHIHAELGEIVSGAKAGRKSASEITLFKSVGNAVQDLAAASRVLANAKKMDLGKELEL